MRLPRLTVPVGAVLLFVVTLVGVPPAAFGGEDSGEFSAKLLGINETPSINTDGSAMLRLTLEGDSLHFQLKYANLSAPPAAAHIHFAQQHVAGAVVVFFCGGGGQAACPASTSGAISGTISAAHVVAVPAQGIKAGDLASVIRAIREGATYANMHTVNFPAGEIRGQIMRDAS